MTAALQNTLRWPARALMRVLHGLYIDWLIRSAERDIAYMQHEMREAAKRPAQINLHRKHIGALRARRIRL